MTPLPLPENTNDRLDQILYYLHRMDRRDRWRTIGGFFRSLLTLIPLALFLWSAWYFYQHSAEVLEQIGKVAAEQAMKVTQNQGDALMQQMQKYMK